jgi:hypothetical protein
MSALSRSYLHQSFNCAAPKRTPKRLHHDDAADSRGVGVAGCVVVLPWLARRSKIMRGPPPIETGCRHSRLVHQHCHTRISSAVDFEREVMG